MFQCCERDTKRCGLELGEMLRKCFGRAPAVKQFEDLERERSCTHPLSGHIIFEKELPASPITNQVRRAAISDDRADFGNTLHQEM